MNHRNKRPRRGRAGCKMCKPQKMGGNHSGLTGPHPGRAMQEARAAISEREYADDADDAAEEDREATQPGPLRPRPREAHSLEGATMTTTTTTKYSAKDRVIAKDGDTWARAIIQEDYGTDRETGEQLYLVSERTGTVASIVPESSIMPRTVANLRSVGLFTPPMIRSNCFT